MDKQVKIFLVNQGLVVVSQGLEESIFRHKSGKC